MRPGRRNIHRAWVSRQSLLGLLALILLVATGCGSPSPTPPDATIRVAVLTPMSGELGTFGETVRNGISLAFDEWNDRGGAKGRSIEWILEDTRCDPVTARLAAERVIVEEGVRFLVGGVCSEAAIPIARVADEHGALFIAATATHPLVTVDERGTARPMAFRAAFPYPYQGRMAARFALDELKLSRAALLVNPADSFARSLTDEFSEAFVAGGGQVVATANSESQDADFTAFIADVIQSEAEVLYVPETYPVADRVGSQIRAQGLDVVLIGSELWDRGALDLESLDGSYFTVHYRRDASSPVGEAWAGRYLSAFALEPDTLAALGYDAASLLTEAVERADTSTPDAIARTLEVMEFEGVTGRWRFDALHNPIKPVVLVRIEGGDVRFHSFVWP